MWDANRGDPHREQNERNFPGEDSLLLQIFARIIKSEFASIDTRVGGVGGTARFPAASAMAIANITEFSVDLIADRSTQAASFVHCLLPCRLDR